MVAFACTVSRMARPKNDWKNAERMLMARSERRANGCWEWIAGRTYAGYGAVYLPGENRAHRAAYKLWKGNVPPGMQVRHTCDNRTCINPDHLLLGTAADNAQDAMQRGRLQHGSIHWAAKVNEHMVKMIRKHAAAGTYNGAEMAKIFGLSHTVVCRIIKRKIWTHVE